MIGYGCIFGFVWLVLNWKQGPKLRKLSVINQVLAIFGPIVIEVFMWVPGLSLEIAIWLSANLTYRRLASGVVYCR